MFGLIVYGSITFTFLFIVYLIMKNQDEVKSENRDLAKFCEEGRNYIRIYNDNNIDDYLRKLFRNQELKEKAILARERYFKQIAEEKAQDKIIWGERRKFGYKYELLIFSLFGNEKHIDKDVLLKHIIQSLNISMEEATDLLKLWHENYLVRTDYKNKNIYEIGSVLDSEEYKLVDTDLTLTKWLEQNKKNEQLKSNNK